MESVNSIVEATLQSWDQIFKFMSTTYKLDYNDVVNKWVSHINYKCEFNIKSDVFKVVEDVAPKVSKPKSVGTPSDASKNEEVVAVDKCKVVQKNGKVCGKSIKSDGVCALHLKTKPVKSEPEVEAKEVEPEVKKSKTKKVVDPEPEAEPEVKKSKTKKVVDPEPVAEPEVKKSKTKKVAEPEPVAEPEAEVKKSKSKKEVEPEPVAEPEVKKSKSKEEPRKLQLKKYNDNMYLHEETNFVFNKEDKMVVGKLNNNKVVDLSSEDIELCNKWKFKYIEPKKINKVDKPEGESDDSDIEDSDVSSSEEEEGSESEEEEEEGSKSE